MLVLILLGVLSTIGVVIYKITEDDTCFGVTVLIAVIFICMLVGVPIRHWAMADMPAGYAAMQETIDNLRERGVPNETAMLVDDMMRLNKRLASLKYWNEPIWVEWFIPDKAANISYIK